MDWKIASSYYESRLSDTLSVCRYALNLAMLPQAEIPSKLKDILLEELEPARRQLERLRKREFRIAVVGLEKAGKSTFINAWLECDLLPAKAARCTFTTTQIYSVTNDSEQRLEVLVKTDEQFFSLINGLKAANAQEDLNTIQQHEATLSQVRRDGNLTFSFTRLEDIKEQLRKYVADERYAHAVLEARLYTSKLAQAEGIVFYDVPGLDSGLAKHVDEAQQMLSDCDAVILVQRFTSLREKELEIIKFTEHGDRNVSVADKLFVFLSRVDSLASPEALKQHIAEASQDWLRRTNLPDHRIVHGSAGAYLVLNGLADKQTQLEIGDVISIQNKLKSLTVSDNQENLIQEGTGIPEIKSRIFQYINTERVSVLKKRCDASIIKILDTSEEIYDLARKNHPENPEEAKRFEEERQRILFAEWWHNKWEQIKADLQNYYNANVINQGSLSNKISSIDKFRQRYLQVVADEIQTLKQEALVKKDIIFAANATPSFDRTKANFSWREDIYNDVSKSLSSIASQLAIELQDEALRLVEYMANLLWGSKQVKERLIFNSNTIFLSKLETSLSVLFLRFARPVSEALIRGPVNSDTRNEIIKNLGVDIEIVDNYYSGEEPAFKVLKKYAKYGADLLFSPELRLEILGINEVAKQFSRVAAQVVSDTVGSLITAEESVVFEVENDIKALEEYLQSAIFDAAGFESFFIQELKALVDSFRDKEGTWAGVALNEWLQENPSLLAELPTSLKPRQLNLEVSERLRQLSAVLKKAKTSGYIE
uniref:Dynamin N-terminal domain-containing protein n=1 Tax=Cyanothece sp. (strain PCC 7425 / ATCC 29141) TaxID=395961 RepID=B8HYH0_CYAP4